MSKLLRENFGLFATGVALVSTIDKRDNHNILTINSLSSVSLEPALLLFCIDNSSSNFEAFTKNKNFAVNLLTYDQLNISKLFSQKGQKDYDLNQLFFKSKNNNLILKDSLGYFECERYNLYEAGDHNVIIGKIINFAKLSSDKNPLLYYKGNYK